MLQPEAQSPEPVFDPKNVGKSLDLIAHSLPVRNDWFVGAINGLSLTDRYGSSTEIDGTREYITGDDVRHIDWKLSAKNQDGSLQIRERYDEIKPNLWIVTDAPHESYSYGTPGYFSEQELALSAIMAITRTAQQRKMPFGVLSTNGAAIKQRKLATDRTHLLPFAYHLVDQIHQVDQVDQDGEPSTLKDLLHTAERLFSRNVVVVVSDFRDAWADDPDYGWEEPLQRLYREKNNQLIVVETANPWDFALPEQSDRFTGIDGVEYIGGKQRDAIAKEYKRVAAEQQSRIDKAIASAGGAHVKLDTTNPRWMTSLNTQLRQINRRMTRRAA